MSSAPVSEVILNDLAERGHQSLYPNVPRITLGMATCGVSAGADEVLEALKREARKQRSEIELVSVGCYGMCWAEPLVGLLIPGKPRALYKQLGPEHAADLIGAATTGCLPSTLESRLMGFTFTDEYSLVGECHELGKVQDEGFEPDPSYLAYTKKQNRLVMGNCGLVDPSSLAEYVATGGYFALAHVLSSLSRRQVIDIVEMSGLRGRGGAGFLTGAKWRIVSETQGQDRLFIMNADEGDPGAYMDRGLIESDPHRVLEGLAIGAYATGANQAVIFIRSEYTHAIKMLETALEEAKKEGIFGEDILGSGYCLRINIAKSAGSFICGEETAMLAALEDRVGEPSIRPPYPAQKGYMGEPTCLNNVETLANIPNIIMQGYEAFRSCGTGDSPGTKLFTLVGAVERCGLVEVPLGMDMMTIVSEIGGAVKTKGVQIGGPSGALLPADANHMKVSFEGLESFGGVMGSGGLIVLGENQCIVDTVLYCLRFATNESCGKCTPCRDGLAACCRIVEGIASGNGSPSDIDTLVGLALYIQESSFCSFGRMIPTLILSSLRHFRSEFNEHIEGHCRALVCKDLIRFEIIAERCQGERCCLQTCPGNAIKGPFGKAGHIVDRLCMKCSMCTLHCPYDAIRVVS